MKLKPKILSTFFLFLIINLLIIKCAFHFLLKPIFIVDTKKHMIEYGKMMSKAVKEGKDYEGIAANARNDSYIQVVASQVRDGIFEFDGNPAIFVSDSDKEAFQKKMKHCAVGEELFYFTGKKKKGDLRLFYMLHPLPDHYILMSKGLGGMMQSGRILTRFSFYSVGVFALCILILCLYITNSIVKRLNVMCRITNKMAHLEFDEKLMFQTHDEIGELAASIDTMSDELKENIDEMNRELKRRKNLVRNVAHDIRTPLTIIRGYAENIGVLASEQRKIQRYSNIIVEECDRLNNMSNGMLALITSYSAGEYYKKEPCDTEEFFNAVLNRLIIMEREDMVQCSYDKAVILIARDLVEYALYNMLDNAVKYGEPNKPIYLIGEKGQKSYSFTVKNSGEPMSNEDIKYFWDALYKADRSRKRGGGYGIGLAIVKQMALFHRGNVRAWSEDGYNYFSFSISMEETDAG